MQLPAVCSVCRGKRLLWYLAPGVDSCLAASQCPYFVLSIAKVLQLKPFSPVSGSKLPQNSQPKPLSELQMESALIIKASLISSNHFLESHSLNTATSSHTSVKSFGNCILYEHLSVKDCAV